LAGFASRVVPARVFNEAFVHSRLWWPDIVTVTIGAVILTVSFIRSEERPYLPSALLTYGLFLPLSAAGYGLGSGVGLGEIWPQGLYVFLVHFSWATFFALLALFLLRFYPTSLGGITLTGLMFIVIIAVVTSLTGFGRWTMEKAGLVAPISISATPTSVVTLTFSPKPNGTTAAIGVPTATATLTPVLASLTPRPTLAPTETATSTVTSEPTPIIALVRAAEGGGAFIREKPGGLVIATLGNGASVTIFPNDFQEVNKVIWVHVFAIVNDKRVEGWMIQAVLQTATPVANWQPSPTQAATQTP
jgi:hypothetical protein